MLPSNDGVSSDIKIIERENKTYKMEIESNKIIGILNNDLKAIEQAVYKIIRTERYEYPIYSWNYGIEWRDLFGMPTSYCIPEIERRIKEALLQDTRIKEVENFEFEEPKKGIVFVRFTVYSIYGNLNIESEVRIS